MKKTMLTLAAIIMMVCLAVPVSAATIKLNGSVGYEKELELTGDPSLTINDIIDDLNLDLGLSITEGNFSLKLGANIRYDQNADNFANIASDAWYAAIDTPNFDIWYSVGINEGYKFEPLGDVFGLGATIYDGSEVRYSIIMPGVLDGKYSYWNDAESIVNKFFMFDGIGYTYDSYDFYNLRATSLLHISTKIWNTQITAYYAPAIDLYIRKSGYVPLVDVTNPLLVAEITKTDDLLEYYDYEKTIAKNVVLFRSQTNLFASLNLGATLTFADTTDDGMIANFGLDLTSDIPLLGGNLELAFAGTITPDPANESGFDLIRPITNGYGFYAGVLNVPLNRAGTITIDVDFAATQEDAVSPFTNYESDFVADTKRLGVALAGKVNVGIASFDIKIANNFIGEYQGNFTRDILTLSADVNLAENYDVNFSMLSIFDLTNDFGFIKEATTLKLDFMGRINDKVKIGANFTNIFWNLIIGKGNSFATEISVVYDDSFAPTAVMDLADFTLAGSVGYLTGDGIVITDMNQITYNLFASIDVLFVNKFGLEGGIYLGYNPEMHPDYNASYLGIEGFVPASENLVKGKKVPLLVATLTAKYYLNPSVYAYATGTFRNWWTFNFLNEDSYIAAAATDNNEVSHFYGQIGVTANTKQNVYLNVSMGRNGLADTKISNPDNNSSKLPWSSLEIAPKNAISKFLVLNIDFNVKF